MFTGDALPGEPIAPPNSHRRFPLRLAEELRTPDRLPVSRPRWLWVSFAFGRSKSMQYAAALLFIAHLLFLGMTVEAADGSTNAPSPMYIPMSSESFLTLAKYAAVALCTVIFIVAALEAYCVWKTGKEAITATLNFITQGDALRMMTVIVIICAASLLVVLGRFDGPSAATIFSGIAGYVLGTGMRSRNTQSDKTDKEDDAPSA